MESHPIPRAKFTRMWLSDMSLVDIAAHFGCSTRTATYRAKSYGLPGKRGGPRPKADRALIREMYCFGLELTEIAKGAGVHEMTVRRIIADLGLPMRGKGYRSRQKREKLEDFLAHKLAARMAETARIEQRQIKLAEMWDQPGRYTSGKRKAA